MKNSAMKDIIYSRAKMKFCPYFIYFCPVLITFDTGDTHSDLIMNLLKISTVKGQLYLGA